MVRFKSLSRFLKDAFFCLLPVESQQQGFLGTVTYKVVYWTSALNRCREAGDGRIEDGQKETGEYRTYSVRGEDRVDLKKYKKKKLGSSDGVNVQSLYIRHKRQYD